MQASAAAVGHQGQPCLKLTLPNGDSALIALHGAQVISWVASGRERLFLSPLSVWDGKAAIRGGMPICFPQFNQRGSLPKHGFARNLPWLALPPVLSSGVVEQSLVLRADEVTRQLWPVAFSAVLTVTLSPGGLCVALVVGNAGDQALSFTGALHTYLAVDDIAQARLHGLQDQAEWNALTDARGLAASEQAFDGEFDRVYAAAPQALHLHQGDDLAVATMAIEQGGFDQSVVWNPGADLCARLADMPADGFRHMLCVEAACVDAPATVPPGGQWRGWQRLTLNG